MRRVSAILVPAVATLLAAVTSAPLVARAGEIDPDSPKGRLESLARMKRDVVWEGVRARAAGVRPPLERERAQPPLGAPLSAARVALVTPEILMNDNSGDLFLDITNSEVALAAHGPFVLSVWNDGSGNDRQGWALSTDGGGTWTDYGSVPPLPGNWKWRSDPVLSEANGIGRILYCALADSAGVRNGLWLVPYYAANQTWETPVLVRAESNATAIVDKPWLVADPLNAEYHLVYTLFDIASGLNFIVQQTLTGLPISSIGPPLLLSSPPDAGRVQGARIALLPNGDLAAVWAALGTGFDDFLRFRRTSAGIWQPEQTIATFHTNFGTGAPGFNRPVCVYFPSLAVDASGGSHHGRMWVAWPGSMNHLDDILLFPPLGSSVNVDEVEPNGTSAQATPFSPGDVLRGVSASVPGDIDYFTCTLSAGDNLVLWADSLPPAQTYRLEVEGPGGRKLAFGGDTRVGPTVSETYYVFTAPLSGSYHVRFKPAFSAPSSVTGGYRVRTLLAPLAPGDQADDRRDIFASWSDDGITWYPPVEISDSPRGCDDWLPELVVGADGYAHATWYDGRNDAYMARTRLRLSRDDTPNAAWLPALDLSTPDNDWGAAGSNLAPNMGDYTTFTRQGVQLRAAWADVRHGTPDAFSTAWPTGWDVLCPVDLTEHAGNSVSQPFDLFGLNPVHGYTIDWTAYDMSGSIGPLSGTANVVPLSPNPQALTYIVPMLPAGTVLDMVMELVPSNGGPKRLCQWRLLILDPLDVSAPVHRLALAAPAPNPSRVGAAIAYSLARAGGAELTLHAITGTRLRTLASGPRAAGPHRVVWDGRDEAGREVPPGLYFVRLRAESRTLETRLARVR